MTLSKIELFTGNQIKGGEYKVKKKLSILTIFIMMFAITACGNKVKGGDSLTGKDKVAYNYIYEFAKSDSRVKDPASVRIVSGSVAFKGVDPYEEIITWDSDIAWVVLVFVDDSGQSVEKSVGLSRGEGKLYCVVQPHDAGDENRYTVTDQLDVSKINEELEKNLGSSK